MMENNKMEVSLVRKVLEQNSAENWTPVIKIYMKVDDRNIDFLTTTLESLQDVVSIMGKQKLKEELLKVFGLND